MEKLDYEAMPILKGWKLLYGGSRKGAYLTVEREDDGAQIDARTRAWLDYNKRPTSRKTAHYIVARRFSYRVGTAGIGEWFLVELP